MKGKLIKLNVGVGYRLDDEHGDLFASTLQSSKTKLSFNNCEAIANGYDLDELSKKETRKFLGHDVPENIMLFIAHSKMFQVGFQKAIEILGDKKFTEKDMIDILKECLNDPFTVYDYVENKLRSIQQTEWEVEIVMDRIPADLAPGGWDVFPKLDENECLILKRIN
jgi:hypothetical protein